MKKSIYRFLLETIGGWLPVSYRPFGKIGKIFRAYCASKFMIRVGVNCNIEKGARVGEDIMIGDNSGIGINCIVQSGTIIGKNVMMGPECMIYTENHAFDEITFSYKGYTKQKTVIIEDNVWIGARVIILPGVRIGMGYTVGAGAVVTKIVPPFSVAVGNPAVIKRKLK